MVVDTSALLSLLLGETNAGWVAAELDRHSADLAMSTVNLTEALIVLADRQPDRFAQLEELVFSSGIRFVPPDLEQASLAARARLRFPLNLGDCFAYALAAVEKSSILTTDRDFRAVDVPVVLPES